MLNLMSKPELKAGLASTSSHVTSGRLTPHLQSVRPSFEDGDLLNQEASNASVFPLFHYWKPCLIEQYYGCFKPNPTADLNFYRYLSLILRKCQSLIQDIRAVFINIHYALALFNVFESKKECDFWLSSKSENTNAKGNFLPSLTEGVSVPFEPRR